MVLVEFVFCWYLSQEPGGSRWLHKRPCRGGRRRGRLTASEVEAAASLDEARVPRSTLLVAMGRDVVVCSVFRPFLLPGMHACVRQDPNGR